MPSGETIRVSRVLPVVLSLGLLGSARAGDLKIYDDGELALWGRENPAGVSEPAVPTYYGGALLGNFKTLEAFDKVPGQPSWPLTVADIAANGFVRPTYQMAGGATAPLGTSVVGTMSYRTSAALQYIPEITRADVTTGGSDRLRTVVTGRFGSDALASSIHTFPDPPIGSTAMAVTAHLESQREISLDTGLRGNDAFRLVTVSSMFAGGQQYDANVIRWTDPGGGVQFLRLTDSTPRDAHLFAAPVEIAVGGSFELIKEPGSDWCPASPSIRVDLLGLTGVGGRVGIQGWLASTTNPNDDSLTVWLEWIDAPATIPAGAAHDAQFAVTATPPANVPEPTTWGLLISASLVSLTWRPRGR